MAGGGLKGRVAAQNRKARHNYFIEDTVEAGIELTGSEVKSLRAGRANIGDSFAEERGGEMFLVNAHISPYAAANRFGHEPLRPRRLLLHKREIGRLLGKVQREGYTLVPLSVYFNDRGRAKVELALGRGRKNYDKRERDRERDWQRDKARVMRAKG